MKLDKIKFAQLINYIGRRGLQLDNIDLQQIDELIDIEVEQPKGVNSDDLAALLQCLASPGYSKIEAIKMVRNFYGMTLKDAKDFVEQNYSFKHDDNYINRPQQPAQLKDILGN